MSVPGAQTKTRLIERLARRAGQRPARRQAGGIQRFVRGFFAQAAPGDIIGRDEDALLGAALAMWGCAQSRQADTPVIRIFNPGPAPDGRSPPRTVILLVNDDMPFLVDSVTNALNGEGLTVNLLIHPVYRVRRDAGGKLIEVLDAGAGEDSDNGVTVESMMYVEIAEQTLPEVLKSIEHEIARVLDDVRAAIDDWRHMRVRAAEMIAGLDQIAPAGIPEAELEEAKAFLRWIDDNHFTFLGYRDYAFETRRGRTTLRVAADSGLGLLRDPSALVFEGMQDGAVLPPDIADFLTRPQLLMISKANRVSTVHRRVHLDTIGVKRYDRAGKVIGLRLFAGLFTSAAYNRATRDIPMVRRKVANVMRRSGLTPTSHNGKSLLNVLETLPRDELFQIDEDTLLATATGVMHLQERQRVALFVHCDPFGRFVSCLVYVPRERYNTRLRLRAQRILEAGFDGRVTAQYTEVSESVLARLQFIIKTTPGGTPPKALEEIEAEIAEAARDWNDDLSHALTRARGTAKAVEALRLFGDAFPVAYREKFAADRAVRDIAKIEEVLKLGTPATELYREDTDSTTELRFKIYVREEPAPLSDVLPVLENMGLKVVDEVPHRIRPSGAGGQVWLHDFGMLVRSRRPVQLDDIKAKFEDGFARVWAGETEDDGFNRLIVEAGLDARQIVVLRAYCKYLRQAAIPFSQAYMEATLAANPRVASLLVALFEAKFDPAAGDGRAAALGRIRGQISRAVDAVDNSDEDRILRRYLNVIEATLRTNHYQRDAEGAPKPALALKIDSRQVDELPLPRPMVEVMVYSPRVEAIHLRGGKVARGGIRWSDRREDFRTEILGLMKAQMTKNAVIVPVGAKGGFIVKRPPPGGERDAVQAEGIACYKTFMRALLDVTDNIGVDGTLIPPSEVVRHDGDDPYLVVAADKGTARFSDIANAIAQERGFWLDDAFASGGSAGYDHKAMGITARGAWESVMQHFREMGRDTQTNDFTVIGIGDMSGDVFGNGMLRSRHIRLLGAFNHLHIFVDPDPDAGTSFAERARLFALARSSWADYDAGLISKGGGVFDRRAKSIPVSPQMRAAFDLPARETIAPNELIRAMLKAEVDLLWFGGIGTYVKGERESHLDVGDRVNDSLRVDGGDLRAKVVAEGANLGVTQLGRIAYALNGGRINTDFIDNSAGVDCSDHEVNIKILLVDAMAGGRIDRAERDRLMVEMTDEVAQLVLLDNDRQTRALSYDEAGAAEQLDAHAALMRELERDGRLNRAVEFLPDDEEIGERRAARRGLTRPEIAVLLAYGKIDLFARLLDSDLPDDPHLKDQTARYFPTVLRQRFSTEIARHRLQREISATYVTNSLVNRVGPTFVREIADVSGRSAPEIVRAFLVTREVFALPPLWSAIEALDSMVNAATQTAMSRRIGGLIERATMWFLRNEPQPLAIDATIEAYAPGVARLGEALDRVLSDELKQSIAVAAEGLRAAGVPDGLAGRMAALDALLAACDIICIARNAKVEVEAAGKTFFELGARFGFDWLRLAAERVPADTEWQRLALATVIDDLYRHQTRLAAKVLKPITGKMDGEAAVAAWIGDHPDAVERSAQLLGEFRKAPTVDLAMLTVAGREIESLVAR